ncbi:MAG: ribosome assembly RNA-binding protein YhbY [Clostridiales bacterium]|nr:MAG: ribosome assembly RNA-binding protein YhbY [Clostridiales bacterium]
MTSKQRAFLRGLANNYDVILIIGKDGVTDNVLKQADDALEARELIKIKCLESAMTPIRDIANDIVSQVGGDVVQVIGAKAVLYRPAKKPIIVLPK